MKKILKTILVIGALLVAHLHDIYAQNFVHPGGLVTLEDIDRISYLLNTEKDPTIQAAFNKLKANSHAQYTYNPNAQERIVRGTTSYPENYSIAMNDVAAAFQNALMWRITGDTKHADCAMRILNAWARTCKEVTGDTNASLASGIYGYEFAQAGELLRGYAGWSVADFKNYQNWMRNVFYIRAMYFLELRHGRTLSHGDPGAYFSNWGLCNLLCVMSIGILCDDVAIYNQGLSYYKEDKCNNFTDTPRNPIKDIGYNEFLGNLVVWLHPDARGPFGYLGQMQESGRDQGHATMAAGLAADICQTAWNQGDDLYAYMNNRIAAGFEYIALVNSLASSGQVVDSVPFIPYERSGLPTENYTSTQNGLGGWGAARPYWHRVVAHYEGVKGVSMPYSRKMAAKGGVDGGGGDYGSTSGGFDHLGFSTLTSYRPITWYPATGYYPVTLGASITYNGKTIQDSYLSKVSKGSVITLTPSLPEGATEDGNWKWETGAVSRELTFPIEKSGVYRVTYTAKNGVKSTQAFNIAVWGDCTPDIVRPKVTVGDVSVNDTVLSVLPYQRFILSINTANYYNYGSAQWSTGATGFSLTLSNGVRSDSIFSVDYYNVGGFKTTVNFYVKLVYITPSVSIDGATAQTTNRAIVEPGQNVELKPLTTTGYDGGTFRWSSGHLSKNLMVQNIQQSKCLTMYYTLTKNGVTTIDTVDFQISVARKNYQIADGDYYIQRAIDKAYLTNPNANATDKLKPYFREENASDQLSQVWTITKDNSASAGGRFKMVSKKDGNYVSENASFGTNPYYSDWNTYTFHCLEGENLYAIQNGGKSGTLYWVINGDEITGKGSATQNGYPFLITPIIPNPDEIPEIPGSGIVSYVSAAYSVDGGATQRGDKINIEKGKSIVLKPVKVTGLDDAGSWLWDDNSTESTLVLDNVQNGGVYSVNFTYQEEDTVYVFPITYTIMIVEDNYKLQEGDYRILRASDDFRLTNNGSLIPVFTAASADSLSQLWTISIDPTTNRHKIVSRKDGRFMEEHGKFNTSVYSADWNSYLFHYQDQGEKLFAIQNAGSAGNTYWAIEGNNINNVNHTTREGYPFKFELIKLAHTAIGEIGMMPLKIYSNLVSDYLIIDVSGNDSFDAIFSLYTIDGQKVKSIRCTTSENKIDMKNLSRGLYLGVFSSKGKDTTIKIIKH